MHEFNVRWSEKNFLTRYWWWWGSYTLHHDDNPSITFHSISSHNQIAHQLISEWKYKSNKRIMKSSGTWRSLRWFLQCFDINLCIDSNRENIVAKLFKASMSLIDSTVGENNRHWSSLFVRFVNCKLPFRLEALKLIGPWSHDLLFCLRWTCVI